MKREYAEAYVRWADIVLIDLDWLWVMGIVYACFVPFLFIGTIAAQRFVFPCILLCLFVGYCILTAALKQKYCELSYFQKFLNIGAGGLFARLMFLLIALSILELSGIYGLKGYSFVVGVWLFLNVLDYSVVWWRIRSGRFYAAQERRKEREKRKKNRARECVEALRLLFGELEVWLASWG